MTLRSLVSVSLLFAMLAFARSSAALTVDIDALENTADNPITVTLEAGTYTVTPIGTADGGAYDAWNPWGGDVSGCDATGENCTTGWENNYSLASNEWGPILVTDGLKYETPLLALANAQSTTFTLVADGPVRFFEQDCCYEDNIGGLSLRVEPVPEPATWLLVASGMVALAASRVARRRD